MSYETLGVNVIAIIPQVMVFFMSLLSIYAMHSGGYKPPARVVQGLAGAIFILGFALYISGPRDLDEIGRGIMWLGVTLNLAPRFLIDMGDMKWLIRKAGVKAVFKQSLGICRKKPHTKH